MIIIFGGRKGGTGKTTTSTNIAAYLVGQGADVVLVDADPQGTAARWVDRRNEYYPEAPSVQCVQKSGNIHATVRDLADRYEHVIIDAGGQDSEELRTGIVAAQVLYTPLQASQPDLETVEHMEELITLARGFNEGLIARALISRAPTNPMINEAQEARALLTEVEGLELSRIIVRERKAYRDAITAGLGVVELDNTKAKAEIQLLAQEIFA